MLRTCKLRLLIAIFIPLFMPIHSHAQQQTGELTGQITDSTGAVIPGAVVMVTNPTRGIKVSVTTNAQGTYIAPLLPPADGYEISASKNGFKSAIRQGITLQVAQVAQIIKDILNEASCNSILEQCLVSLHAVDMDILLIVHEIT